MELALAVGCRSTLYARPMFTLAQQQQPPTTTTDLSNKHHVTIMTYNVLAQHLVSRSWFGYAKADTLKWKQRKLNLAEEIEVLDPDVLCLQECSE